MKRISALLGMMMVSGLVADGAAPSVSGVTVSQSGRVITVGYDLSGSDAIVTATFKTNGVVMDCGLPFRMVGDVARKVEAGEGRAFFWSPDLSLPGFDSAANGFTVEVKAWRPDAPPDYLAVDLASPSNRLFFAEAESVPGSVTNDLYRTDWILMRRIPVSSDEWRMGSDSGYPERDVDYEKLHYVKLTKDYYIGIFELTQGQYHRITGERPAYHSVPNGFPDGDLKPVECLAFDDMRGKAEDGYDWPSDGHAVSPASFMGKIRAVTGIEFDFPTDAQWEYACRAGAGTFAYNGNGYADSQLVGWCKPNANQGYETAQTHVAGMKPPNAFGLYDMLERVRVRSRLVHR